MPTVKPKFPSIDAKGAEILDPQPIAVPLGFEIPETTEQLVARLVRTQVSQAAGDAGHETFDESEDFDVDDDFFEPNSPYEEVFDPILGRGITHQEFLANREVYDKRYQEAEDRAVRAFEESTALRGRRREEAPGEPPTPPAEPSGPQAAQEPPAKK